MSHGCARVVARDYTCLLRGLCANKRILWEWNFHDTLGDRVQKFLCVPEANNCEIVQLISGVKVQVCNCVVCQMVLGVCKIIG